MAERSSSRSPVHLDEGRADGFRERAARWSTSAVAGPRMFAAPASSGPSSGGRLTTGYWGSSVKIVRSLGMASAHPASAATQAWLRSEWPACHPPMASLQSPMEPPSCPCACAQHAVWRPAATRPPMPASLQPPVLARSVAAGREAAAQGRPQAAQGAWARSEAAPSRSEVARLRGAWASQKRQTMPRPQRQPRRPG
jgi:hypothetical protein